MANHYMPTKNMGIVIVFLLYVTKGECNEMIQVASLYAF